MARRSNRTQKARSPRASRRRLQGKRVKASRRRLGGVSANNTHVLHSVKSLGGSSAQTQKLSIFIWNTRFNGHFERMQNFINKQHTTDLMCLNEAAWAVPIEYCPKNASRPCQVPPSDLSEISPLKWSTTTDSTFALNITQRDYTKNVAYCGNDTVFPFMHNTTLIYWNPSTFTVDPRYPLKMYSGVKIPKEQVILPSVACALSEQCPNIARVPDMRAIGDDSNPGNIYDARPLVGVRLIHIATQKVYVVVGVHAGHGTTKTDIPKFARETIAPILNALDAGTAAEVLMMGDMNEMLFQHLARDLEYTDDVFSTEKDVRWSARTTFLAEHKAVDVDDRKVTLDDISKRTLFQVPLSSGETINLTLPKINYFTWDYPNDSATAKGPPTDVGALMLRSSSEEFEVERFEDTNGSDHFPICCSLTPV